MVYYKQEPVFRKAVDPIEANHEGAQESIFSSLNLDRSFFMRKSPTGFESVDLIRLLFTKNWSGLLSIFI